IEATQRTLDFNVGCLWCYRNGANTKGYFVWSFMDVFELITGYQSRFGLYFVNFDDENRPRKPKLSAQWYSSFLKQKKKADMRINMNDLDDNFHARY
ncbi:hypothetical protein B296_00058178, partial [Ensete ventricosum]